MKFSKSMLFGSMFGALGMASGFLVSSVQAAPGDFDFTFNPSNTDRASVLSYISDVDAIALQSDGKIVVAGWEYSGQSNQVFCIERYTSEGEKDNSFEYPTGHFHPHRSFIDFGSGSESAKAIAVQNDGKIVVVGVSGGDFAVARLNTNGSPDNTFSSDGKVKINFGNIDIAYGVVVQSDGKIVVVGSSEYTNANGRGVSDFSITRLNSNGSLDSSFDGDGKTKTQFELESLAPAKAIARSVALMSGKIVVAGSSIDSYGNKNIGDFALARYNSNGSLDTSLGTTGKITFDLGGNDVGNDMKIQADGKILVAGYSDHDFVLTRHNTNGHLDSSFNSNGSIKTDFGGADYGTSLAVQSDGKIVVVGKSDNKVALSRYNTNGSLDVGFSGDGKMAERIPPAMNTTSQQGGMDVILQPDGKILVAASFYDEQAIDPSTSAIVRYLGDSSSSSTSINSSSTLANQAVSGSSF